MLEKSNKEKGPEVIFVKFPPKFLSRFMTFTGLGLHFSAPLILLSTPSIGGVPRGRPRPADFNSQRAPQARAWQRRVTSGEGAGQC